MEACRLLNHQSTIRFITCTGVVGSKCALPNTTQEDAMFLPKKVASLDLVGGAALAHIKVCLIDMSMAHEEKIRGCAYLLALWF